METTGEAIGQNMLAPDYSPHPPQTSRGGRVHKNW